MLSLHPAEATSPPRRQGDKSLLRTQYSYALQKVKLVSPFAVLWVEQERERRQSIWIPFAHPVSLTFTAQFTNLVGGSQYLVGDGLESCTTHIQPQQLRFDNYRVTVIDAPRFDDTDKTTPISST
jgi:hypothetical protein